MPELRECPNRCGYSFSPAASAEAADWLMQRHVDKSCPKPGRPPIAARGWPRSGHRVPRHIYVGPDKDHELAVLVVDAEHVETVSAWVVAALGAYVTAGHPYPVELRS